MTKMTPEDDSEAYLNSFERMATMAGWPKFQWATILSPYLTGPVQMAVDTLPIMDAKDYEKVKGVILSTLNVSENTYRARMWAIRYEKNRGARWAANLIHSNGMRWLKPQDKAVEEVVEMIWLEQFEAILPPAAQKWVLKHWPQTLEEAVQVMECYEEAEKYSPEGGVTKGEAIKGTNPPKGNLGRDNAPALFSPSGRGRRMEERNQSGEGQAPRPGASSTPRTNKNSNATRGTRDGDAFPRPRR